MIYLGRTFTYRIANESEFVFANHHKEKFRWDERIKFAHFCGGGNLRAKTAMMKNVLNMAKRGSVFS